MAKTKKMRWSVKAQTVLCLMIEAGDFERNNHSALFENLVDHTEWFAERHDRSSVTYADLRVIVDDFKGRGFFSKTVFPIVP